MTGLTALDVFVLLAFGGGMVFGFLRGFVTEVLSLLTWVAVIIALKVLHSPVSAMLTGIVGTSGGAAVLAFAVILVITFIAGKIIASRFGGITRSSIIGPFDRLLGAGFGALKGLIGVTLLYLLANLVYDTAFGRTTERPAWMTHSRTYPLLNASGRAIVDFVQARRHAVEKESGNSVDRDAR